MRNIVYFAEEIVVAGTFDTDQGVLCFTPMMPFTLTSIKDIFGTRVGFPLVKLLYIFRGRYFVLFNHRSYTNPT